MRRAWLLAGVLLFPALAGASGDAAGQAQFTLDALRRVAPIGPFEPEVGQWVVYRIGEGAQTSFLTVALLGREKTSAGEANWLELGYGYRPEGGMVALKMRVVGDPRHPRKVDRLLLRLGGGRAMELNPGELAQVQRSSKTDEAGVAPDPGALQGEPEYKQVHGGSFNTHRVSMALGTVWIADKAPMFHIVAGSLRGVGFELYSSGTGAKDWVGEAKVHLGFQADGGMIVTDGGAALGGTP